jgi:hypothetical protein
MTMAKKRIWIDSIGVSGMIVDVKKLPICVSNMAQRINV